MIFFERTLRPTRPFLTNIGGKVTQIYSVREFGKTGLPFRPLSPDLTVFNPCATSNAAPLLSFTPSFLLGWTNVPDPNSVTNLTNASGSSIYVTNRYFRQAVFVAVRTAILSPTILLLPRSAPIPPPTRSSASRPPAASQTCSRPSVSGCMPPTPPICTSWILWVLRPIVECCRTAPPPTWCPAPIR